MKLGGWEIDKGAFALFVNRRRDRLKLTDRDAAVDAGVAASTIAKAEKQKTLSAPNYLALCLWMGCDPFDFLIDPQTGKRIPSRRAPVSRGTHTETAENRA